MKTIAAFAIATIASSAAFAVFAAEEYTPKIEKTIPLDIADPTLNMWKEKRADLQDGREPGLINIQRYPGGTGFTGIPTFFRLPVWFASAWWESGCVRKALPTRTT